MITFTDKTKFFKKKLSVFKYSLSNIDSVSPILIKLCSSLFSLSVNINITFPTNLLESSLIRNSFCFLFFWIKVWGIWFLYIKFIHSYWFPLLIHCYYIILYIICKYLFYKNKKISLRDLFIYLISNFSLKEIISVL